MRIVYTAGTFDLFHIGHLNVLRKAREVGDRLIVGVSTDELVKSYKNESPIMPYADRLAIVQSCRYVDEAVKQEILIDRNILIEKSVDVVVLGDDWQRMTIANLERAKKEGLVSVLYVPYTERVSSTQLKRKIKNEWFGG